VPAILQKHLVSHAVHGLPETLMAICHQLAVFGETLHRFGREGDIVTVDVVEYSRLENHKPPVYPSCVHWLLRELDHLIAGKSQLPETGWWVNGSDGGELAMGAMKCQESRQVHVANGVPKGEHERVLLEK